jgi:hypothetical protein
LRGGAVSQRKSPAARSQSSSALSYKLDGSQTDEVFYGLI